MKKYMIFTSLFLCVLTFSQKAYEPIYYMGKVENIKVKFTLGNGYIAASEIKTTDIKTQKISKFLPENGYADDENKLKFYHFSSSKKAFTDYFIIDQLKEQYENIPLEFKATYFVKGKRYKVTLKKYKK